MIVETVFMPAKIYVSVFPEIEKNTACELRNKQLLPVCYLSDSISKRLKIFKFYLNRKVPLQRRNEYANKSTSTNK